MASIDERISPVSSEKNPKKIKLDIEIEIPTKSVHDNTKDLSKFNVDKILYNNSNRKTVCLQGSFKDTSGIGIVLLEKTAFEEDTFKNSDFLSETSVLKKLFHNDIYGNYECYPKIELNAIKTTIIHPATEKHIQKFSTHNAYIIDETTDIYLSTVLKHIKEEPFSLQWVYNILEHKSETERIVFEDVDKLTGFVLLPDLKWNGKTLETLYLLAIIQERNIKSLRDLSDVHLPLLKNIRDLGTKAIEDKYGLPSSQLRIYLHYQPSFYHLHVHFTYLQYEAPGINAERSHLLSNVISNIELKSDYYQQVTLPFVVRENDHLFKKLEAAGLIKKIIKA